LSGLCPNAAWQGALLVSVCWTYLFTHYVTGYIKTYCCKNGVLPVQLGSRTVATIIEEVEAIEGYEMKVDLEGKTISLPDGKSINFEIDESLRQQLLFGLDTISLTMEYKKDILEYEAKHRKAAPWLFDNSLS
jgi:3-isopropylmalate/(R)-2-methylmalate dehydratase small subunit